MLTERDIVMGVALLCQTLRKDAELRVEVRGQEKGTGYFVRGTSRESATIELKLSLLQSAVEIYPGVFNGYNALGYAWLEKGEVFRAVEAFHKAIEHHPEEKAGYFDLAHVYLEQGKPVMAVEMLEKAVAVDPTSKSDLLDNPLFSALDRDARFQSLLKPASR